MRPVRPRLGSIPLVLAVSVYLLALTNDTFWRKAQAYFVGHEGQLAALGLCLLLLCVAALTTFSAKFLVKPFLILAILIAAMASYFVDTFGLVIDRDMIQNVALTTTTEAAHLLSPGLVVHLLAFGVLPSLLVALVRVVHRPFWQKVKVNSLVIFPCLGVTAAIVFANYPSFSSTFRSHRDLLASFNPGAPIVAAVKYAVREVEERDIVAAPLGTDARQAVRAAGSGKPLVTVVVVGETARAMNFGLYGYDRDTNPELGQRDVVAFQNVASCGTSTAVSVPCMFSNLTRAFYSSKGGRSVENLTDVIKHADVDVRWLDNNTGSAHVADRIPYEYLPATNDPRFCSDGECHDEILVEHLRATLADVRQDTVIFLHQLGSHGPAYYLRSPEQFQRFLPACRGEAFADCSREEIVNAYDNTILYTDHILSEIVDLLAGRSELAASMLYVSDHGESLGENGLYLHAMPYFMAPSTQTHVPMIAWFSESYRSETGVDAACIAGQKDADLSHDNFFHTVLGTAQIKTTVYDPGLDALAPCRSAASRLAAVPGSGR